MSWRRIRGIALDRGLVVGGRIARLLAPRASDELARLHRLSPSVEALNVTRPKVVAAVHARFLEAGADAILTNTADAAPQLLDRARMSHEAFPVTYLGATLAADVAAKASTADHPRLAIGDVRIPWRQPLAGFARPAEIEETAHLLVSAQAAGGVDAVLLEVAHDSAVLAAAVSGARAGMAEAGRELPIMVLPRYEAAPSRIHAASIGDVLARAASVACGLGVMVARLSEDDPAPPGAVRLHLTGDPKRVPRLRRAADDAPFRVSGRPTAAAPSNRNGAGHAPHRPRDIRA